MRVSSGVSAKEPTSCPAATLGPRRSEVRRGISTKASGATLTSERGRDRSVMAVLTKARLPICVSWEGACSPSSKVSDSRELPEKASSSMMRTLEGTRREVTPVPLHA